MRFLSPISLLCLAAPLALGDASAEARKRHRRPPTRGDIKRGAGQRQPTRDAAAAVPPAPGEARPADGSAAAVTEGGADSAVTAERPPWPVPVPLAEVDQRRLERLLAGHERDAARLARAARHTESAVASALAFMLEPIPSRLLQVAEAAALAQDGGLAQVVYRRLRDEAPEGPERAAAMGWLSERLEPPADLTGGVPELTQRRVDLGRKAFREGTYAAAIAAYAMANAMQGLPLLLFNAAQAYRRQGRVEDALVFYLRFLQTAPAEAMRRESEGYVRELRQILARPPAERLLVVREFRREARPAWRLAVGGVGAALGAALVAAGAAALSADERCVMEGAEGLCLAAYQADGRRATAVYESTGLGVGLVVPGAAVLLVAGALSLWPGRRREVILSSAPAGAITSLRWSF